jgi:signal transduction histidine kinase
MRLERKLHDGASLRISAMSLRLGLLRGEAGDLAFQQAVDELQDELHTALDELRAVADNIYPPLLDQAGLGPALRELAVHSGHEVTVRAVDERFGTAVEGAAYFAVADCLAAWVDATGRVDVTVQREDRYSEDRYLVVTIKGVPACHADVVADHAEAMGGIVEVQDTAVQDTAVQDTAVQDTAVQDTAVQNTAVQDTAVQDTAVQDTAVQNTAVQNTAVLNTAVLNGGTITVRIPCA